MELATLSSPSTTLLRDFYSRMLLTRVVDEYTLKLYEQGRVGFVASCRGHEAAQVGSAACIEVGKDFTLPYYRDLGVVLTIGMTPYEVFRTYLQAYCRRSPDEDAAEVHKADAGAEKRGPPLHWGYHKHNMVTGPAPVATQIMHAAGIAFACKLRKAPAVTVAYCGDGAAAEHDFLEGITFAVLHELPAIFICEQDCPCPPTAPHSLLPPSLSLPAGLEHHCIGGTDVAAVYISMNDAIRYARAGRGPVLLELQVVRSASAQHDPLLLCQRLLEERGAWDEQWVVRLYEQIKTEVEQALEDALRDSV